MPKTIGGPGSGIGRGMFSTGDLLPQASGSASIGVNQVDGIGGFAPNSIKPYAHIHINSGVWHDITGSSGVIRFANSRGGFSAGVHINGQLPALEISSDGGASFPLRLGTRLDAAAPTFGPHGFIQGGDSTKNLLFILNSGQINIISELSKVNITSADNLEMQSDGIVAVATNNIGLTSNARSVNISALLDANITVNNNVIVSAGNANTGGQLTLKAFASSGRLEYRFGPYQGWAAKLTHSNINGPASDGFWPMPHSGQILEQIVRREKSRSMTIERPAVNNDLTWFYTNQAITITEIESVVRGAFDASGSFAIRYGPDRSLAGTELTSSTISCSNRTTGQITSSFAAANIPVDNWIWIAVSGVSGVATTQLGVTIHFN